jgi:hypothetical protein
MAITILGSTSSGGGGSSIPVVQSLPDNNATITAGTTVARIPALTASRFYNLPLASGYPNGSTLTILDSAGSLSSSVVANISSASDIINSANPLILSTPYASPVLISNGVDRWTLDIRGVSRGGTGATDAAAARTNLGLGTGNSPIFTGLTLGTSGNLFGGINLIEQRNGTNAQAFRVYNTYDTAGANYDRLSFFHAGGQATIATEGFGANVASSHLTLAAGGTTRSIFFQTAGIAKWVINSAGHFLAQTELYDIGANGANRPRNIYVAGDVYLGGVVRSAGGFKWFTGGTSFVESANGVVKLQDNAGTDFGRLQLGGTTSAFPAIKRNGTGIDIRLADDSAFAPVKGKLTTDTAYTATVVATTGYITIYDSTGTAYRVPCAV